MKFMKLLMVSVVLLSFASGRVAAGIFEDQVRQESQQIAAARQLSKTVAVPKIQAPSPETVLYANAGDDGSLSVQARSLCYGSRAIGTNGDWEKCVQAANAIASLNNKRLKVAAQCLDARNDGELRLMSGCYVAAFVVMTNISILPETEKVHVAGKCESSGWLDGQYGDNECIAGQSHYAKDAKQCAVDKAVQKCLLSGQSNCPRESAAVTYEYYFYNDPHCVAAATIIIQ